MEPVVVLALTIISMTIMVITGLCYAILNFIYCSFLDDGTIKSHFKIVRNGDGTISLKRKELFGLWTKKDLLFNGITTLSCTDNDENIQIVNERLDRILLDIDEKIEVKRQTDKERSEAIIAQKTLPKIIRKYP